VVDQWHHRDDLDAPNATPEADASPEPLPPPDQAPAEKHPIDSAMEELWADAPEGKKVSPLVKEEKRKKTFHWMRLVDNSLRTAAAGRRLSEWKLGNSRVNELREALQKKTITLAWFFLMYPFLCFTMDRASEQWAAINYMASFSGSVRPFAARGNSFRRTRTWLSHVEMAWQSTDRTRKCRSSLLGLLTSVVFLGSRGRTTYQEGCSSVEEGLWVKARQSGRVDPDLNWPAHELFVGDSYRCIRS
jgi:hypothetical protein